MNFSRLKKNAFIKNSTSLLPDFKSNLSFAKIRQTFHALISFSSQQSFSSLKLYKVLDNVLRPKFREVFRQRLHKVENAFQFCLTTNFSATQIDKIYSQKPFLKTGRQRFSTKKLKIVWEIEKPEKSNLRVTSCGFAMVAKIETEFARHDERNYEKRKELLQQKQQSRKTAVSNSTNL